MGVPAPRWAYGVGALAVFFYLHMDCLDGKQARRTGTSSPLGQLFDHGCDALALVVIVSLLQTALPLVPCSRYAGIATLVAYGPWILAHWEEYHTGTMSYSSGWWGVTEANLAVVGLLLVTSLAGPSVWESRPLVPVLGRLNLLSLDLPAFHAAASNASQTLSEYAVISAALPLSASPGVAGRTLPVSLGAALADVATSPLAAVNLTSVPVVSLSSAKNVLETVQAVQSAAGNGAASDAALDVAAALSSPAFDPRFLLAGPVEILVGAVTSYLDVSPSPTWSQAVYQATAGAQGSFTTSTTSSSSSPSPSFFALLAPAVSQVLAAPRAVLPPLLASLRLADMTLLFLAFNGFVMASNQVLRVLSLSGKKVPGTRKPGGALEPDERGAKTLGVAAASLHLFQILLLVSGTFFATRSLGETGYGYDASLDVTTGEGVASGAARWAHAQGSAQSRALFGEGGAAFGANAIFERAMASLEAVAAKQGPESVFASVLEALPRLARAALAHAAALSASLTSLPVLAAVLEGARVRAAIFGLGYALCASRLILAHMAKQPWDLRGPAPLVILAAALNESLRILPQATLLPILALLQLFFYLSYVVVEIRQICTSLGIKALTIPVKTTKKE